MFRKFTIVSMVAIAAIAGLSGCASGSGESETVSTNQKAIDSRDYQSGWYAGSVEGTEVYCLFQQEGYAGGMDCDWDRVRAIK